MTRERGQLVVLAAAAIAIALVPMALAYLQLGYHEDIQTATVDDETVPEVERTLERSLVAASSDIPAKHSWDNRSGAVTTLRDQLQPSIDSLTTAALGDGTAIDVSYNNSHAQAWEREHCPQGPDRSFGPCQTDRGVVIQNRDSRTHVLAVAVDIQLTTPDRTARGTTVLTVPIGAG
ncbi:DUF7261 family protein [Salinibaculum rarum]|uniref:DUF7261 family protein n=1 Tax=Salinibaculum rarum TaxID=3058903 RepID=UPI00265E5099|nr:hypothetical protein [Salinibaculum sp. KK48]